MTVSSAPERDVAPAVQTVETGASWLAATVVLFIFTFSYGAPLVVVVALKEIAADFDNARSTPALAYSLAWLGSGTGALAFGWIAERFGIRPTVFFGAVMLGAGLAFASIGGPWELLVGHGVFLGLLGGGAINIPLIVYISRWFDRRRGQAIALVASGQYVAGALWPPVIALGIVHVGWRATMLAFGIASGLAVALATIAFLRPRTPAPLAAEADGVGHASISGLSARSAYALLCIAGFLCCTPMAMPPAHLVALCSDLGIAPARGSLMLSVLLGSAFISRQFWGWLSDTVGGLYTILAASICQAAAIVGFIVTQDEAGLFAVAAAFGLGFSGIIPAYVLVLRELFPVNEASWRIPFWFFCNIAGMAVGGWLAGYIYDQVGAYGPAFMIGVALNLANILIISWLAAHRRRGGDTS
ncbi:MAG: MFS transporter [Hyphomicrobiaceae bacterium]